MAKKRVQPGRVIDREVFDRWVVRVLVTDLVCQTCGRPLEDRWFESSDPRTGLCASCAGTAASEDYGFVVPGPFPFRPMRYVAAECEPAWSTGTERNDMGELGSGENADGYWDNLVRQLEA